MYAQSVKIIINSFFDVISKKQFLTRVNKAKVPREISFRNIPGYATIMHCVKFDIDGMC